MHFLQHFKIKYLLLVMPLLISIITASIIPSGVAFAEESKSFKLKIAIGRFSNETRYGRSLLRDNDLDPLGKQASDIFASMLTSSGKFLVFERPDLSKIKREAGQDSDNIIGVDTLVLGSIVEFGRQSKGKQGIFNKSKEQVAKATVTVRLVDVKTGLVFHSATGSGEAITKTKKVLGVGSTAKFDATLNDKAISAAISTMMNELINTLGKRKWKTDILAVQEGQVFIAGGEAQGLRVGDILTVFKAGKAIKSKSSGFAIPLPSKQVAKIEIIQLFGETETTQGSVTKIIEGEINPNQIANLYIAED